MSSTEKPSTAGGNAEKTDGEAAAMKTTEAGAQDQAKKDKPKRDRRSAKGRGNKKGEEGKEGQQEPRYQPKGQDPENGAGGQEKKPKQQYRQKGEPKEGGAGRDGQPEAEGDAKKGDSPDTQQSQKKQRQRKAPGSAGGQEPRYRPKGSQAADDGASPENGAAGTESPSAGEGDADGKAPRQGDKKKSEKDDEKKNLIYQNPMEFKETKKFKSKWEEYRLGDWRRGSGKTFVTLETEIPVMPEKLLSPPDEATFHKKLLEIEDKIKSIGQDLEDKKTEFDGKLQEKIQAQKAGDGSTPSAAKDIGLNFQRLAELKKQRKKIYDAQEEVAQMAVGLSSKREQLSKKIDKEAQKEEQIPKAVKQTQKALETQTHDAKRERELLARIKFLKASVEFIREREVIDEQLRKYNEEKKKIGVDLPRIKKEIKELSEVVDIQKKARDEKQENRETLEKELDKINERRKRARDERDKLYKQKYELKDEYYGALITYSKQQFLIKDINWMNEMQGKLRTRQAEKERREAVYKERQERLQKEREERTRKEEERKQREVERRQKEIENKKRLEEQLQQDEIDQLNKIIATIEDKSVGSNPFFEQIEQCEQLTKYCQKQKAKLAGQAPAQDGPGASQKDLDKSQAVNSDLAKAVAKGSVQLAPAKESREGPGMVGSKGKGKKGKRNAGAAGGDAGGQLDFAMIKRFTSLKIQAPLADDSFDATIVTLEELREALIYWGKILQRQKKIKHIRSSRKLKSLDEYNNMADEEEQWLQNEKEKIENAEDDIESGDAKISLAKIKIAQTIDKEMRLKSLWHEEEDEGDEDSEEDRGYTVDDMGDEENPRDEPVQKRERKPKGAAGAGKVKQAQRPNAQKFKEIMKADEAFPTFENHSGDEDDENMNGDDGSDKE